MSKHTPGPWWLHVEYSTIYVEGKARDQGVTQEVAAVGPKEGGKEQQVADAALIVAAPDLLEALVLLEKEMVLSGNAGSKQYGWPLAITKTREAIAKATGVQQA